MRAAASRSLTALCSACNRLVRPLARQMGGDCAIWDSSASSFATSNSDRCCATSAFMTDLSRARRARRSKGRCGWCSHAPAGPRTRPQLRWPLFRTTGIRLPMRDVDQGDVRSPAVFVGGWCRRSAVTYGLHVRCQPRLPGASRRRHRRPGNPRHRGMSGSPAARTPQEVRGKTAPTRRRRRSAIRLGQGCRCGPARASAGAPAPSKKMSNAGSRRGMRGAHRADKHRPAVAGCDDLESVFGDSPRRCRCCLLRAMPRHGGRTARCLHAPAAMRIVADLAGAGPQIPPACTAAAFRRGT